MTTLRRLATKLLGSAVVTLPPDRRPWGAALLAELEQVPGGPARGPLGRGWRPSGWPRAPGVDCAGRTGPGLVVAGRTRGSRGGGRAVLAFVALKYHKLESTTDPDAATAYGLSVMVGLVWALPAVLAVSAGTALLAASWRRRAGVRPGRLARLAAVAAEACVVVARAAPRAGHDARDPSRAGGGQARADPANRHPA